MKQVKYCQITMANKTYKLELSATQIYNLLSLMDANKKEENGTVKFWPLADGGKSLESVRKKVEKLSYKEQKDYIAFHKKVVLLESQGYDSDLARKVANSHRKLGIK